MPLRTAELNLIGVLALLIEFLGSLWLAAAVVYAVWRLVRERCLVCARLTVAEGAIAALSFKVAATLLKTLRAESWHAIAMVFAVVALRYVLKQVFVREQRQLHPAPCRQREPGGAPAADRV